MVSPLARYGDFGCRCLRTYRSQRVHGILSWRFADPYLMVMTESDLREAPITIAPSGEGPEWVEARAGGCDSLLELGC